MAAFYLIIAAVVLFIGMGLGLYTFDFNEIRRPHTEIYFVIVAVLIYAIHKFSTYWLPDSVYHVAMMMGLIMAMLPVFLIGNIFGLHP